MQAYFVQDKILLLPHREMKLNTRFVTFEKSNSVCLTLFWAGIGLYVQYLRGEGVSLSLQILKNRLSTVH